MSNLTWVGGVLCACLSSSALATLPHLDRLEPLESHELASYRAGFSFDDDFFINIGLNIATTINGDTLFTNEIANLLIQNGQLIATKPIEETFVTVVQVGQNNTIEIPTPVPPSTPAVPTTPTPSVPSTPTGGNGNAGSSVVSAPANNGGNGGGATTPVVTPPTAPTAPTFTQVSMPNLGIDPTAISRIIQNSLDGTVLGLGTVINIDAQVGGVIKQLESNSKLQQALQLHLQ